MQIEAQEIPVVAQLVEELCGVVLDETKGYLINSRLGQIVDASGCANFTEFCRKARASQTLKGQIIDAITTQETLFFRDNSPFETLKYRVLPELIDAKAKTPYPKRIRIWSAACSTGQEPYSIAMTLCELIPDVFTWDINILATDIADAAILQGSRGRYAPHEIQRGMDPNMLMRYFREESGGWRVKEELRSLIRFDRRNLLQSLADLGPFDVIFCRNVAIYFAPAVKEDLFHRLADRLTPGGYLFVGSSESLTALGPRFTPQHHCRAVFYRPNQRSAMTIASTANAERSLS